MSSLNLISVVLIYSPNFFPVRHFLATSNLIKIITYTPHNPNVITIIINIRSAKLGGFHKHLIVFWAKKLTSPVSQSPSCRELETAIFQVPLLSIRSPGIWDSVFGICYAVYLGHCIWYLVCFLFFKTKTPNNFYPIYHPYFWSRFGKSKDKDKDKDKDRENILPDTGICHSSFLEEPTEQRHFCWGPSTKGSDEAFPGNTCNTWKK